MNSAKRGPIWSRVLVVGFILGIIDTTLQLIGHPMTEAQQSRLLAFGIGAVIIWLIDDVLHVLDRILEELKKR